MTKEEIKEESSLGISEDINGKWYTIYDFDKMYELTLNKVDLWLRTHLPRVLEYYPDSDHTINEMLNEDMREELRIYMNQKTAQN